MTRLDHLLWILAEECAEVAQRASKAARFGLSEVQPDQSETNAERLVGEYADLAAVLMMLQREGHLPNIPSARLQAKREKVEKFLRYSVECGTLTPAALLPPRAVDEQAHEPFKVRTLREAEREDGK